MKFLVRWAFRLLILVLVLVVGLLLAKNAILKSYAETQLRRQTGLEVRIRELDVGLFSPTVTIQGLRIFNAAEYGGSPFLDLPELHLEYNRLALGAGRLHLRLLRLDLAELNLVRNPAGHTNLTALIAAIQRHAASLPNAGRGTPTHPAFGGIDTLNLSLGKVTFTDLRPPRVLREFRLDVRHEIVTNLRSELDILGVIARILVRRGITIVELPP